MSTNFYTRAIAALTRESDRLNGFCAELDKEPLRKKEEIALYKCARYRYGAVSNVWVVLYFRNKLKDKILQNPDYIPKGLDAVTLPPEEFLKNRTDLLEAYAGTPDDEKIDAALYYCALAHTDVLISKKEELMLCASDWEKIELTEYLEGYAFSRACLTEAWETRREALE